MRFAAALLIACTAACGNEVLAPGVNDHRVTLDDNGDSDVGPGDSFIANPGDPAPGDVAPALVVSSITAVSKTTQSALAGTEVTEAPAVVVRDQSGNPMAGQQVTFTIAQGGGVLDPATVTTDAQGRAAVDYWKLGKRVAPNQVKAALAGNPNIAPAQFDATIQTSYTITVDYRTTVTTAQRAAFDNAAARWSAIIIGDLQDFPLSTAQISAGCIATPSGPDVQVDDIIIFASVQNIDGVGGVLAQSGPCLQRSDHSIIAGIMSFDSADLDFLQSHNMLEGTILHEMGHVIGIGSLWQVAPWNLVVSPSYPSSPGANTRFSGPTAGAAFTNIGGTGFGGMVPLDNSAVAGSADSHWRESIFGIELMTPQISGQESSLPLSIVTIASLADLGVYTINDAAADDYTFGMSLRAADYVPPPPIATCTSVPPTAGLPLGGGIIGLH